MFRLFKRRRHIQIINKKKEYIKPDINTLFRVFNSNNCTKLEIMKEHKAIDFCHFSIELEKFMDLGIKDLNLRHVITNGFSFQEQTLPSQNIYIIRANNKDYTISTSNDKVQISESTLIDNYTHESTLDIDFNNDTYTIGKYIHNEYKSTIYDKWYPSGILLLKEETALETTQNLLSNLEKIENIENVLDINSIYNFMINHTGWNLKPNNHQKILNQ